MKVKKLVALFKKAKKKHGKYGISAKIPVCINGKKTRIIILSTAHTLWVLGPKKKGSRLCVAEIECHKKIRRGSAFLESLEAV